MFGIDDAIIAALISGAATAGTGIYNSYQNKKRLQEQQRANNMANIDEQNLVLQQNLGQTANNRDYIDDRQNQIVLKTRNDNQLKYGGDDDKYTARDNTRTRFVPGTGYIPNAKLNKNTGKNVQYDAGPLGFVPVVGDVLQGGQAVSDLKNKNYKRAALNAGLLFLPNVIERLGKPVVKVAANAIKKSGSKKVAKETINDVINREVPYKPNFEGKVHPAYEEHVPSFDEYYERIYGDYDKTVYDDAFRNATEKEYYDYIKPQLEERAKYIEKYKEELDKYHKYLQETKFYDEDLPFKYGGSFKYHKRKRC